MKKLAIAFLVSLVVGIFVHPLFAADGSVLDNRLKLLLNDETDPLYPDSIRLDFLAMGMKKCATLCKYAATIRTSSYISGTGSRTSVQDYSYSGLTGVTIVRGVKLTGVDYALWKMTHSDIGLKKIATSTPVRYWYEGPRDGRDVRIGVYNAVTESTNVELFLSGIPAWADTSTLHPAFENETVLYALYLCKLRQGERDIANFIRQIATNEILDMKAILENRPFDVTIAKEVVPK